MAFDRLRKVYHIIKLKHDNYQTMDFQDEEAIFLNNSGRLMFYIIPFKNGFKAFKLKVRTYDRLTIDSSTLCRHFYEAFEELKFFSPAK